jgi:hypothetical protein
VASSSSQGPGHPHAAHKRTTQPAVTGAYVATTKLLLVGRKRSRCHLCPDGTVGKASPARDQSCVPTAKQASRAGVPIGLLVASAAGRLSRVRTCLQTKGGLSERVRSPLAPAAEPRLVNTWQKTTGRQVPPPECRSAMALRKRETTATALMLRTSTNSVTVSCSAIRFAGTMRKSCRVAVPDPGGTARVNWRRPCPAFLSPRYSLPVGAGALLCAETAHLRGRSRSHSAPTSWTIESPTMWA